MSIPTNSILNSGVKESKTQTFTKPLRGVLGGRKVTADDNTSSKKIFNKLERLGMGTLLFTIGLPYTLIAGGILAAQKLSKKNKISHDKTPPPLPLSERSEEKSIGKNAQENSKTPPPPELDSSSINASPIPPAIPSPNIPNINVSRSTESANESASSSEDSAASSKELDAIDLKQEIQSTQDKAKKAELINKLIAFYETSVKAGNLDSMEQLGLTIINWGVLIGKAPNEGVNHLIEAAKQGHAPSQFKLGSWHLLGVHVGRDTQKAVQYFQECIKQTDSPVYPDASYELGLCYMNGIGIAKDESLGLMHLKNAADKEHPKAQYDVGLIYLNGAGVKKDFSEAFKYFSLASDAYPEAKAQLGSCFRNGWGIIKDLNQAFSLYEEAANDGSQLAQKGLVECYHIGIGVLKDEGKALNLCRNYADEENADCQVLLGTMYATGSCGLQVDKTRANFWYETAKAQGHKNAKTMIDSLNQ